MSSSFHVVYIKINSFGRAVNPPSFIAIALIIPGLKIPKKPVLNRVKQVSQITFPLINAHIYLAILTSSYNVKVLYWELRN